MQRHLFQLLWSFLDHKRNLLLLIVFFFIVPSLYLVSSPPNDSSIIDDVDICSKLLKIIYHSNRTLCSEHADRRGTEQKIISLSLFGPKENPIFADEKFSQLITPLIDEAASLFPNWTIRLYSDQSTISRLNLKNLSSSSPNLDICNVNQLAFLGNVGDYLSGKLWRFLPALDPMVDYVSSRDLDSPLTPREQAVIHEFLASSALFLSMRDHPLHGIPILGGLWTAAIHRDRLLFLRLFSVLLDRNKVQRYATRHDQTLLSDLIWPKVKDQTLVFDSYTCDKVPHGIQRPYPTQRSARDCHLGCVRPCCQNSSHVILNKPCPKVCRPQNHSNWLFC